MPDITTHAPVTLGKVSSTACASLPDGRLEFEVETDEGYLTIVAPASVLSEIGWDLVGMAAAELASR